ncbi:MAG TPA: exodeoxyribonuclease VII small subunit [Candidatus Saccharibacteria bacterium]|jgi:exodeoxyribonuclease VII small subunit|nr:Exodeoxyribonuclease small subunit [Patescibacteria group bacterium]HMS31506.1 exodeoxyribonuclease VII small subunit [Candidatus Saccharibacteria bacterium]
MSAQRETVAEKLEKLESLLTWFESEEITVEESLQKYEEALQLAKEVEELLEKAKNNVEIIKQKFEK